MSIYLIFIILYFLTGTMRVAYDFYHKSIMSADYVRNPRLLMTISSILFWPSVIIFLFIHQIKRINLKFLFDFYFLPIFYWLSFYLLIVLWFSKLNFGDSGFNIIKLIIILLIFCDFVWWLCSRRDKKIDKIKHQKKNE